MPLVLIGLSHHTAPIEIRERLSLSESRQPDALRTLQAACDLQGVVLLSTCNRLEVYAHSERADPATSAVQLRYHLARICGLEESRFADHLYQKAEQEAVSHLMTVAAGLDSLVLGEAQILGQARAALRLAQQTATASGDLTALFQQALSAGKRVHAETGLSRGAFSIGHAAVDLAKSIFGDLSNASVLLLGAGKMSELTARHLVENGARFVIVANRTYERAVQLAAALRGQAIHYDTFPTALATADIVISSTAAPRPIVHRETLTPVLRQRRGKPLFLIDIAVPRDIDPDVDRLENVFLKNIDDLEEIVADSILERQAEAAKAREIVDEETTKFLTWYRARKAAPVIAQLRARLETIRQEDLSVLRARLGHLSERDWQAIETATLAMMNRVARVPILRLKRAAEPEPGTEPPEDRQYDLLSAAQEIFGLVPEAPPTDVDSPPSLLPNENRDESAVSDRNPPRLPGSLDTAEAAR